MLWTLQKYIFREMGKSFLLTAIGLVAVIGLGGGVMNMIELEGASPVQLLKVLGLIVPVAATLTLPIAALYAATVTYGRMSADNEFVACRSGGINIHLLFLPTVVISLVSAVCSFFFINFVIPEMIMNLDRFVGADLPRLIKQKLISADRFKIRDKYVMYAENAALDETVSNEAGRLPALRLGGVAAVEIDGDEWARVLTAKSATISFDLDDGAASIAGDLREVRWYDAKTGRYGEIRHQPLEGARIPRQVPIKVKWLTLGGLLQYSRQPALFPKIGDDLDKLRTGIARAMFFRDMIEQFRASGRVDVEGPDGAFTFRAQTLARDSEDGRPVLKGDVTVTAVDADGKVRKATGDTAAVRDQRAARPEDLRFFVQVDGHVTVYDPEAPRGVSQRERERFDAVGVPASVIDRTRAYTDRELLAPTSRSLGLGQWVDDKRAEVIAAVDEISREITSELHARLAISISVFVLVLLGAALGIVFRGAQALIAFGISFVPSLFVISTIIMGKQLIDKPATALIGVVVVWSGIVAVAGLDLFVMTKVVRR